MKRFRFRLERVLHFRKSIEAEAKRALQMAQRVLAEAESKLELLEQELVKDFTPDSSVGMRVEEFLLASTYRMGLRVRIEAQLVEIAARKGIVVEKMAIYRKTAQELESLQRHKTAKVLEYEMEVSAAEQEQIDELTVQRYGRR